MPVSENRSYQPSLSLTELEAVLAEFNEDVLVVMRLSYMILTC